MDKAGAAMQGSLCIHIQRYFDLDLKIFCILICLNQEFLADENSKGILHHAEEHIQVDVIKI